MPSRHHEWTIMVEDCERRVERNNRARACERTGVSDLGSRFAYDFLRTKAQRNHPQKVVGSCACDTSSTMSNRPHGYHAIVVRMRDGEAVSKSFVREKMNHKRIVLCVGSRRAWADSLECYSTKLTVGRIHRGEDYTNNEGS